MAKKNWDEIAKNVHTLVGGDKNIKSFTNCQTRLRINVKDISKVDKKLLSEIDGSFGVNITGEQVQVVFGTGYVVKAANSFEKATSAKRGAEVDENADLSLLAKENKEKQKVKNTSVFQRFIGKFASIFAPMVLGFIGAGILSGISGILNSSFMTNGHWTNVTAESWSNIFGVLLNIWKATFLVIVGWRTSEAFGGTGVIGAIIAGLYVGAFAGSVTGAFVHTGSPTEDTINFLGIKVHHAANNWLTAGFRPSFDSSGKFVLGYPSGSVFGVMISAGLIGIIQKGIRKIVHPNLDMVITPTITLLALLILNFVLIFPISGYIFTGVAFLFKHLYGTPFGAALLSSMFLITVVFGVHQGFVPIYAALIAETGVNGLFPVLGMAGAGQVGMAIALWFRAEKNGILRRQIQGAIIPAFLGIGEPLIYGVSLPRVKPFITASIGGGLGGFFIGAINLWGGNPIGLNTMFGPSGLLATPLMTSVNGSIVQGILFYLAGLGISYLGGFGLTYIFGYKNVDLA